jgi:acyl-CoA synthetase (AMP-forming)/AMP-acid ligase II
MTRSFVFIMGSADDCFKSKGVLIAPREVEEAILELGSARGGLRLSLRRRRDRKPHHRRRRATEEGRR